MPQGNFKSAKIPSSKIRKGRITKSKTKKGKLFKPPKKARAKEAFLVEKVLDKTLINQTEDKAKSFVAKEGTKLKILDTPPILKPKQKTKQS